MLVTSKSKKHFRCWLNILDLRHFIWYNFMHLWYWCQIVELISLNLIASLKKRVEQFHNMWCIRRRLQAQQASVLSLYIISNRPNQSLCVALHAFHILYLNWMMMNIIRAQAWYPTSNTLPGHCEYTLPRTHHNTLNEDDCYTMK